MNKHTPGPWKTLHRENNRKHELDYWISGREQIIGNVRIADVVTESNARLIAAAPEMLEALENTLWFLDHRQDREDIRRQQEYIKIVIAKATGK